MARILPGEGAEVLPFKYPFSVDASSAGFSG